MEEHACHHGPANNNDVTGTMKGPGAMAKPIFMAGQCHTPSSHNTSDRDEDGDADGETDLANHVDHAGAGCER